jgi:hypothetical protein
MTGRPRRPHNSLGAELKKRPDLFPSRPRQGPGIDRVAFLFAMSNMRSEQNAMSRLPPRAAWIFAALISGVLTGCQSDKPEPGPDWAHLDHQFAATDGRLASIETKLDKLLARRIILLPRKGEAAPNIQGAIRDGLKTAADVFGNAAVVGFFRDQAADVAEQQLPKLLLGRDLIKQQIQAASADKINSLLQ